VIDADPTSATFNRVVRTLSVGDTAAFVALSPDGSRVYVAHQVPGKVTVIDTNLNVVLGTVATDNDMVASDAYIAVGPDGRVYVTDSDDNRLHITTVSGGTPPILPVTVTPISVGTTPTGVAVSGIQAYAYGNGTVSMINTATKQVTSTTNFSEPSATSPDGTRRHVVNGRSVAVIDTATNAVIANIEIPVCNDCYYWPGGLYGVVVNPNGTRVYVQENYVTETGGTTVVSVIDATTNTLIGAGYPPLLNDLDATPDGRLYAADMTYPAVYVYDANMNGIPGVYVAPPGTSYAFVDTLAISADGTRTYAVVSSWDVGFYHVSVIDSDPASPTYNSELAKIRTQDTAVSLDGSRTYVLGTDGRSVAVIDTATNSLIGTFTTDLSSGSTTRSIAVGPDGTLYVTDSADNKVYAVTVGT
jgi:YVTN family beta-propeller protein